MNKKTLSDNKMNILSHYSFIEAVHANGERTMLSYINTTIPNTNWKITDAVNYYKSTINKDTVIEITANTFASKNN
ncbi:MAG: hypothetical protein LBE13_22720 [Bacteroidales bacterium]|nr:hypothetical protein [Bacteroidales bacterium]